MEKLSKNFTWMAAANIVGGVCTVILAIYLARILHPEALGHLSYAHSFIFYLINFVDLGLSTYGIREVAKNHARVSEYVSEIVSFRIIIAITLSAIFVAATLFSRQSAMLKVLMVETSLILFASALATEWAFQGLERMQMVFISLAATSALQLALVWTFVKGPDDLLKVPVLQFIAFLPVIVLFLYLLKFKLNLTRINLKKMKIYLSSSLIIWGISVLIQAYNGLDIIFLGIFRKAQEVGYFAIARKAVNSASLLMIFLANAVLPRYSATFGADMLQFRKAERRFLTITATLAILVFLPVIVFSGELISLTVGKEYLPANLTVRIMVAGLMLVLFNMPFSTGLIAAGFEREVLKQAFGSAALSVVYNFTLIPRYGMVGAGASFFFAEALALVWILYIHHQNIVRPQKIEGRRNG